MKSDFDHPSKLQSLVAESWNAAVLDCGASKTVCDQALFDTYIETLSNEDKSEITYDKSNSIYWFGDGKKIPALKNAKIPALIGSQKVMIDTDIVNNKVTLLLSREPMKRANIHLNFQDDTVSALGQTTNDSVSLQKHNAILLNSKLLDFPFWRPETSEALEVPFFVRTSLNCQQVSIH